MPNIEQSLLLLWGEIDIALIRAANVGRGEIEGKEAESLALRVDMMGLTQGFHQGPLTVVGNRIKVEPLLSEKAGIYCPGG